MIGKFKRFLKRRCPECKNLLEIRVIEKEEIRNGLTVIAEEEYIICSNRHCYYEEEVEKNIDRRNPFE